MKDRNKTFLSDSIDEGGSIYWYVKPISEYKRIQCNIKIRDCSQQIRYEPNLETEEELLEVIEYFKNIVSSLKVFKESIHVPNKEDPYKNMLIWNEGYVGLIMNINYNPHSYDSHSSPCITFQDSSKSIELDFGISDESSPKFPLHLKSRKSKVQVLISEFERIILALEGNKGMFTNKF